MMSSACKAALRSRVRRSKFAGEFFEPPTDRFVRVRWSRFLFGALLRLTRFELSLQPLAEDDQFLLGQVNETLHHAAPLGLQQGTHNGDQHSHLLRVETVVLNEKQQAVQPRSEE